MHVNAKKMAFSGLLLALTVILIVLSGVFEIWRGFLYSIDYSRLFDGAE